MKKMQNKYWKKIRRVIYLIFAGVVYPVGLLTAIFVYFVSDCTWKQSYMLFNLFMRFYSEDYDYEAQFGNFED